jgi:hypothetical protein
VANLVSKSWKSLFYLSLVGQKFWENLLNFSKIGPKSHLAKNAKISITKLKLKAKNIYIKPLLKP